MLPMSAYNFSFEVWVGSGSGQKYPKARLSASWTLRLHADHQHHHTFSWNSAESIAKVVRECQKYVDQLSIGHGQGYVDKCKDILAKNQCVI